MQRGLRFRLKLSHCLHAAAAENILPPDIGGGRENSVGCSLTIGEAVVTERRGLDIF